MMKTINKILALAACCLSVASCNDENLLTQERESWQGNDKISLSLTAAPETRAGDSRAVDVTVDEGTGRGYHISDFVIFQFDENGNRIVDPKYYEYTPDAPNDPGQTIPVVLPTADGVEYTVVVLANYHEKLSASAFAAFSVGVIGDKPNSAKVLVSFISTFSPTSKITFNVFIFKKNVFFLTCLTILLILLLS